MAAKSLIDEAALPAWLRAQQERASAYPSPAAVSPAQGMSPADTRGVAPSEPMPAWLNQVYADANVPRLGGSQQLGGSPWAAPSAGMERSAYLPPASGMQPGLNSGDLVDESALPGWLRAQTGSLAPGDLGGRFGPSGTASAPAYGGQAGAPGMDDALSSGSMRFSASDLIDPGALPDWVRSSAQAPEATFSSTAGWTGRGPAAQMPGGLAGASAQSGSFGGDGSAARRAAGAGGDAQVWSQAPSAQRGRPSDRLYGAGENADFGNESSSFGSRGLPHGPGIPEQELPPWLRGGAYGDQGAPPGARTARGGDRRYPPAPAAPRYPPDDEYAAGAGAEWQTAGYEDQLGGGYASDAEFAAGGDGAEYGGYDMTVNEGYYGSGYDENGYGHARQETNWTEWEDEPPKRGWRRLFGRR